MSSINSNMKLWLMGLFLALVVLIAKSVIDAGIHPIYVSFFQASGSALYLISTGAFKGVKLTLVKRHFSFFVIASLLGFTIPQLIVFSSVNHVGVGIASLSYALPLIVTYLISLKMGLEPFNIKGLLFLLILVVGTFAYLFRSEYILDFSGSWSWIILLSLSPISIGIANVYRSVKWPTDLPVLHVALLTNLFSAITYLFLILILAPSFDITSSEKLDVTLLLFILMLLSGTGQFLLFSLQKSVGPVFIGQTGSIVTLFGGVLGYVFYGDSYSIYTFIGSLFIFIGVFYYSKYKLLYTQK